jgi:hypothetical protein
MNTEANANSYWKWVYLLLAVILLSASAHAQSGTPSSSSGPPKEESTGVEWGDYEVHQTLEFGGRIADHSGSDAIWSTYVNLFSGPRLFHQSFEMVSRSRQGTLFDRFSFNNMGYGGDPNNLTRARLAKDRIYDFSAQFRRDRNFFDYNLLANPLNPLVSSPSIQVLDSPHLFANIRRLWDYKLTILPQSRVRFRLGYSRNVNEGPTFSSIHTGTDALVFQDWRNTTNAYSFGVDVRILPRTTISYDQTFSYYKGDTFWGLAGTPFSLSNGTPVDLGLPINTPASQPCATPILGTGFVNPTCNAYTGYNRFSPIRSSTPVEQINFQSSYFKRVELTGRFTYSASDYDVATFLEEVDGRSSRTNEAVTVTGGPIRNRRVNLNGDFGVTVRLNDHFKLIDNFHWNDNRLPGSFDEASGSLFSTSMLVAPNVFNPATCPATPSTCPTHTTSSPADVRTIGWARYLGQDVKSNTTVLDVDVSRKFGLHAGYRYQNRFIAIRAAEDQTLLFYPTLPNRGACAGVPLQADGSCLTTVLSADGEEFEINEHAGLGGFWLQPSDRWRLIFDAEVGKADRAFTRTSPRSFQTYKWRFTYKPIADLQLTGNVRLHERRNTEPDVRYFFHDRSYGFSAVYSPERYWSLDFHYSFNDVNSRSRICYILTPAPAGTAKCGATTFLEGTSDYQSSNHYFDWNVMVNPVRRVRATFGYTLNTDDGRSIILNPLQPLGPLSYEYHMPSASVQVELAKQWTWRTGWNYYGYHENSAIGPTAGRNMRGNVVNLSLKYSF